MEPKDRFKEPVIVKMRQLTVFFSGDKAEIFYLKDEDTLEVYERALVIKWADESTDTIFIQHVARYRMKEIERKVTPPE
jgi:hypothetical protein